MKKSHKACQPGIPQKPGRNEPCPCGSGRKHKVCCGGSAKVSVLPSPKRSSPVNVNAAKAHLARATRAREAGSVGDALAALRQALTLDPENALHYLEFGNLMLENGQPAEALPWFNKAVELQPGSAKAHLRRGFTQEQLGWHSEAADSYHRAIALSPGLAEAHVRLGTAFLLQDQRLEAAQSFRRAAVLSPKTTLGRLSGALALQAEGAAGEAQAALRRLVALSPGSAVAHAELGKLLAEEGKAEEARSAFEKAVALDPRSVGHYYDIVRIRPLTREDRPLLNHMLEALKREDLHDMQRIMLSLAIGKAYDDFDDAQQAMHYYMAANRLKGRIRPLDRALISSRVDWLQHTFTAAFLKTMAQEGSPDETPLLILGMPRSGTTLVESILACHSSVAAGQELSFWNRCGRNLAAEGVLPSCEHLSELADSYLKVLRNISNRPHVTDKKPDNFFWVGLIHLVFPQARIIHCRRNRIDTCVSIQSNFFAPRPDFSTETEDLVFYYREYERLMAHWRTVMPAERYLEIDYEELVRDPEPVIHRVIAFCGLDWQESCLHPERNSRTVNTASLWQVRRPIFVDSVDRWKRWEPWLAELRQLLEFP